MTLISCRWFSDFLRKCSWRSQALLWVWSLLPTCRAISGKFQGATFSWEQHLPTFLVPGHPQPPPEMWLSNSNSGELWVKTFSPQMFSSHWWTGFWRFFHFWGPVVFLDIQTGKVNHWHKNEDVRRRVFKIAFYWSMVYNVVLVSTGQQSVSAVHVYIPPLSWISFPFRSPQIIE